MAKIATLLLLGLGLHIGADGAALPQSVRPPTLPVVPVSIRPLQAPAASIPPVILSVAGSRGFAIGPLVTASAQGGIVVANPIAVVTGLPRPSIPAISVPALPRPSLPAVSVPALPRPSIPAISVPALPRPSIPAISVPALPRPSIPAISVPALPRLSLPAISVPALPRPSLPAVSIPALPRPSVPAISVPALPRPSLGVPSLPLPGIPSLPTPPGFPGIPNPGTIPPFPSLPSLPDPSALANLLALPGSPSSPSTSGTPGTPGTPGSGSGEESSLTRKICAIGEAVISFLYSSLGSAVPSLPSLSSAPAVPGLPLVRQKRQLLPIPVSSVRVAVPTPALTGGAPSTGALTGGVAGSLLSPVSGVVNSLPLGGSVVGSAVSAVPVIGSVASTASVAGASGVTGALGGLSGAGSPLSPVLNGVTGTVGSVPVVGPAVGSAVNALPVVGGGSSTPSSAGGPLGTIVGPGSVVGAVTSNLASVASGPLAPVASAISPVTGAVNNALGTVGTVAGSLPLVGGVANQAVGAVQGVTGSLTPAGSSVAAPAGSSAPIPAGSALPVPAGSAVPNLNPATVISGIPGTDPVGGFSIAMIATLLSLLKKDPLSLFAPSLPVASLVKRDVPHLAGQFAVEVENLQKRQLPATGTTGAVSTGLPSLSQGLPGIGVGSLPLSGIPGVSPDLAFLVGSIAKNLAIPGGNGLGSITGNIISILNGIIPEFVFKLPVVQDSVATFGVLQLLAAINPTKFSTLGGLTNLASLQQAISGIPASDLAILKGLPLPPDPTNLITTVLNFADNVLTIPGQVSNLKASVAALAMRTLGLTVPGLS